MDKGITSSRTINNFIQFNVVSQQVTDVWKGLKTAELLIEQYLVRVESKSATFSGSVQPN